MRPCSEPRWSRPARSRLGRRRKEPKDDGGRRRKHGRDERGKRGETEGWMKERRRRKERSMEEGDGEAEGERSRAGGEAEGGGRGGGVWGAKSGVFSRGVRVPGDPRHPLPSCWRPAVLSSFIPFLLLACFLASSPPLFLSLTFVPSKPGGESWAPVANRGGPAQRGVVSGDAGRSRRMMEEEDKFGTPCHSGSILGRWGVRTIFL
jgi:hypothetical protein